MNLPNSESLSAERHSELLRELRNIRNLIAFLILLAITAMSAAVDRELPLIILPVGLMLMIGWAIFSAFIGRSRRARREAHAFRALSGRAEPATK